MYHEECQAWKGLPYFSIDEHSLLSGYCSRMHFNHKRKPCRLEEGLSEVKTKSGSGARTRTLIPGSKGPCPAVGRPRNTAFIISEFTVQVKKNSHQRIKAVARAIIRQLAGRRNHYNLFITKCILRIIPSIFSCFQTVLHYAQSGTASKRIYRLFKSLSTVTCL